MNFCRKANEFMFHVSVSMRYTLTFVNGHWRTQSLSTHFISRLLCNIVQPGCDYSFPPTAPTICVWVILWNVLTQLLCFFFQHMLLFVHSCIQDTSFVGLQAMIIWMGNHLFIFFKRCIIKNVCHLRAFCLCSPHSCSIKAHSIPPGVRVISRYKPFCKSASSDITSGPT